MYAHNNANAEERKKTRPLICGVMHYEPFVAIFKLTKGTTK